MRNTFQNEKTQDQKNQIIQQKIESETKKKTNQSKKQPQETKWLKATRYKREKIRMSSQSKSMIIFRIKVASFCTAVSSIEGSFYLSNILVIYILSVPGF